ncbi:MAG: hypothetical protein J5993_05600 [Clostridia bacterium]|nr:hypothetical protein [Clostridia bacterium]
MSERSKKWFSICLVLFLAVTFLLSAVAASTLTRRYAQLQKKQEELNQSYIALQYEYAKKQEEYEAVIKRYQELEAMQEEILANFDKLEQADVLAEQLADLRVEYENLKKELSEQQINNSKLQAEYAALQKQYDMLMEAFETLKEVVPKETLVKTKLPGVVCFGDSLTAGNLGNGGWSYPSQLSKRMNEALGVSVETINEGRGGWTSEQLYYLEPTQIAKSGWGNHVFIIWMGINGGWEVSESVSVPVTDEAGNPVLDGDGQPTYTTETIVDEQASINKLIYQIQYILNCQTDPEARYLVVGLSRPTNIVDAQKLETEMQKAFGDKFVNIRQYLMTDAITDANLQLTDDDRNYLAIGRPPASFMARLGSGYDPTHFNDTGYTLIGNYLYERMESLGYFNSAKEIISWY